MQAWSGVGGKEERAAHFCKSSLFWVNAITLWSAMEGVERPYVVCQFMMVERENICRGETGQIIQKGTQRASNPQRLAQKREWKKVTKRGQKVAQIPLSLSLSDWYRERDTVDQATWSHSHMTLLVSGRGVPPSPCIGGKNLIDMANFHCCYIISLHCQVCAYQ